MRKIVLLVALVALFPLLAGAQDFPRAEVFGGYQFLHFGSQGADENFNGWNASVAGNFTKNFGVAADFSGTYKTISGVSVKAHTYTFGPVVSLNREGTFNPFVHALFGGAHLNASVSGGSGSTDGFAMLLGGGVDAKVAPHIAVRLFQADYTYLHFSGQSFSKNVRVSTGIVFRF